MPPPEKMEKKKKERKEVTTLYRMDNFPHSHLYWCQQKPDSLQQLSPAIPVCSQRNPPLELDLGSSLYVMTSPASLSIRPWLP